MKDKLEKILSVSGKGGLFKLIKASNTGVVGEYFDQPGKRLLIPASNKVSVLSDISIYVEDERESVPLSEVFQSMLSIGDEELIKIKSGSKDELMGFLEDLLPDYDRDRVYASDVKKLISWFLLIKTQAPETFEQEEKKEEKKTKSKSTKKEGTPKKTTKKSSTSK